MEKTDTLRCNGTTVSGIGEVAATRRKHRADRRSAGTKRFHTMKEKNVVNSAALTAAVSSYKSLTAGMM